VVTQAEQWYEQAFLYIKSEDYDSAVSTMIDHPTEAWRQQHFKGEFIGCCVMCGLRANE